MQVSPENIANYYVYKLAKFYHQMIYSSKVIFRNVLHLMGKYLQLSQQ